MFRNLINKNKFGFFIIIFIFFISANIAWLNPAPGKESYQPNKNIPLFWQYNYDSGIEILSAAYFPKIYFEDSTRIDRPTYPLLVNILGRLSGLMISPFYKLNELEKAGIGYLLLKLIIFFMAIILSNEILTKYFDKKNILLSQFLIFFSIISIPNITTFHTIELQFITPIILLFLFLNIINNYSVKKNIIFSIIVGTLMLAKPNYAIYLTIVLFSLLHKKILEVIISFVFHFLPLITYIFFLKYIGLSYKFVGTEYGQGIWLISNLNNFEISKLLLTIFVSLKIFLLLMFDNFSFWLILSILGLYINRKKIDYNILVFILFFAFFTWLQIFVSDRNKTYMTSDLMIIVYPLSTVGLYFLLSFFKEILQSLFIKLIFIYIFTINISSFINLPLIHPYDQPAKNSEKLNKRLNELIN